MAGGINLYGVVMKRTNVYLPVVFMAVVALVLACAGQDENRAVAEPVYKALPASTEKNSAGVLNPQEVEKNSSLLDEIAELERSGIFLRGMGLREAALRQKINDHPGAVLAVFKELSWAYGHGLLEKNDLTQGIDSLYDYDGQGREDAAQTVLAIQAFMRGNWTEAEQKLIQIFGDVDDPDGYFKWMILSCALEKNPGDRKAILAYRSIRARNDQFPEFWYRGARIFTGIIAAQYAEYCIALAPDGPFAGECRSIIAVSHGLRPEDGAAIKSKTEVESLISQAVSQGNPRLLEPLMPLIGLPENPYTIYTLGALKPLGALPLFKEYFEGLALKSRGRLADRLIYICRG